MEENEGLYEQVGNYTKFKLIEMLIKKYQDKSLDNFNAIEQLADDITQVLSATGLKFYSELQEEFENE
mgnify:CR=1 FL=1